MNFITKNQDKIITGKLKNGLQYIVSDNQNIQSVALLILFRYGSGFDKMGKSGMAHLLEHLMFKGSKNRPHTKDIMAELNSIGAEYNAYTSKTFTGYHTKTAHMYLETSMEVITDFLKTPKFMNQTREEFMGEFEQEKNIVLQELLTIKDQNSRYIHELVEKNLFSSPFNRNFENDIHDIKSITLDDVINTYKKYYCAENMIVSIHGNLGSNNIKQLLEKYFTGFHTCEKNTKLFKTSKNPSKIKYIDILKKPHISKCNMAFVYPTKGYEDRRKYYMVELFGLVFADLTSGRLFQNIREKKGLIYSIRSAHYSYDHQGYFAIQTNTNEKNLEKVTEELHEELEAVRSKGLTQKEFDIAIKNYSAKLLLDSEDPMNIAEYNAYEMFYNKKHFISYFNVIHIIKEITLDSINKFIKDLLHNRPIVTLIKSA